MLGQIPFDGLTQTTNVTAFAATTSFAKLTGFSGTTGGVLSAGTGNKGDFSVRADKTNNRILAYQQGYGPTYKVTFNSDVNSDTAALLSLGVLVNSVLRTDTVVTQTLLNTGYVTVTLVAYITLTPTDLPAVPIAVSGDPPSTSFAGAGAQAKGAVPIEIGVKMGSGANLIFANTRFVVERMG